MKWKKDEKLKETTEDKQIQEFTINEQESHPSFQSVPSYPPLQQQRGFYMQNAWSYQI